MKDGMISCLWWNTLSSLHELGLSSTHLYVEIIPSHLYKALWDLWISFSLIQVDLICQWWRGQDAILTWRYKAAMTSSGSMEGYVYSQCVVLYVHHNPVPIYSKVISTACKIKWRRHCSYISYFFAGNYEECLYACVYREIVQICVST